MAFFCLRCGECCSIMGDMIRIREELGDLEFRIFYQYTGEEKRVRVDDDKRRLFEDRTILEEEPRACPFLRRDADGLSCCTVHGTWPEICLEYSCWSMLILDSRGKRAGRIMDLGHFCADDPDLAKIWEEMVNAPDIPRDDEWEDQVAAILATRGYRVFR